MKLKYICGGREGKVEERKLSQHYICLQMSVKTHHYAPWIYAKTNSVKVVSVRFEL